MNQESSLSQEQIKPQRGINNIFNSTDIARLIQNCSLFVRDFYHSLSDTFMSDLPSQPSNNSDFETHLQQKIQYALTKLAFPYRPSPNSVCGKKTSTYYECYDCKKEYIIYCEQCFQYENHKGHMFSLVQNGCCMGYCDCGNKAMLKQESFCPKHKAQQIEVFQPEELKAAEYEIKIILSLGLVIATQERVISNDNQDEFLLMKLILISTELSKNSRFYNDVLTEVLITPPHQTIFTWNRSIIHILLCQEWNGQLEKAIKQLFMTLAHSIKFSQHVLPIMFQFVSTKASIHFIKAHYFLKFVWQATFEKEAISTIINPSMAKYLVLQEKQTSTNGSLFFTKFYSLTLQLYPDLFFKLTMILIKQVPVTKWLNMASLVGQTKPDIRVLRQKIDNFFIILNRQRQSILPEDWNKIGSLTINTLKLMLEEEETISEPKLFIAGRILVHSFMTYTKYQGTKVDQLLEHFKSPENSCMINPHKYWQLLLKVSELAMKNLEIYQRQFRPLNISLDHNLLLILFNLGQSFPELDINSLLAENLSKLHQKIISQPSPDIQDMLEQPGKLHNLIANIQNIQNTTLIELIPKYDIGNLTEDQQILQLYRELATIYKDRNKKQFVVAAIIYVYNQRILKQFLKEQYQAIKKGEIIVDRFKYKMYFNSPLCLHESHEEQRYRFMMSMEDKFRPKGVFNEKVIKQMIQISDLAFSKIKQLEDESQSDSQSVDYAAAMLNPYINTLLTLNLLTDSHKAKNKIYSMIYDDSLLTLLVSINRNNFQMYKSALQKDKSAQISLKQQEKDKVAKLRQKKQRKIKEMKERQQKIINQQLKPEPQNCSNQNQNACIVCKLNGQHQDLFYLCHVSYHNVLMKSMLKSNDQMLLFTTCGHMIHNSCLLTSLDGDSSYQSSYRCFLCKKKSNIRLPVQYSKMEQKFIDGLINDVLVVLNLQDERYEQFRHQVMTEETSGCILTADKFYEEIYRSVFLGIYLYFLTDPRIFQLFMQPIIPTLCELIKKGSNYLKFNYSIKFGGEQTIEKRIHTYLRAYVFGKQTVSIKDQQKIVTDNVNISTNFEIILNDLKTEYYAEPEQSNKFIKFNIFCPPFDLTDLKRLAGRCSYCQKPTDKLRLCFLCQAKTCLMCQLKWKTHLLLNHKGISVSVMVRNGVFFQESPIGHKSHYSLYKSFIGQQFNPRKIQAKKGQYELDWKCYETLVENLVLDNIHLKIRLTQNRVPMQGTHTF